MSRFTAAVAGAIVAATVAIVAGCSTAGADVAAGQDDSMSEPQPCDVADVDSLAYLLSGGDLARQMAQPFVFDRVDCRGRSATAYTMADGITPPVSVTFEYSVGCWRPVAIAVRPAGPVPAALGHS